MNQSTRTQRLAELNIPTIKQDIRAMSAADLLSHFGATSSGKLIVSRLIRALTLQAWQRIKDGSERPVEGNLRTFWYRFIKPAVLRVPDADRNCAAADDATTHVLTQLIEQERLFDYQDFGFNDANWRSRAIGLQRPHVLLFAEKTAHVRLMARLHLRLGVSFVALGGSPGACTSAYTAAQLLAALPRDAQGKTPPVHLIGLVDYDPAGAGIAASFADQLRSFGLSPASVQTVIEPSLYDAAQLASGRMPVKGGTRTRRWLEAGGGIDGEPWGLSVESLPVAQVEQLLEQAVLALAPQATPLAMPPGRSVEDFAGQDVVVIASADLGPSALGWIAAGKKVAIAENGRVLAVLAG